MPAMNEVLGALRDDARTALRHYNILIGGSATAASGPATFDFADQGTTIKGFTTGRSGRHGLQKDRPIIRFDRADGPQIADNALGPDQVNAYYVAMEQVGGTNTHYFLPDDGADDLCFTGQLTGCVFGVGNAVAGGLLVSHVQPPGGPTSQRDTRHAVRGGLTDGVDRLFRRGRDYSYAMTIIGVRKLRGTLGFRLERWKFYGQAFGQVFIGGALEAVV
jgi:hypothetical protein